MGVGGFHTTWSSLLCNYRPANSRSDICSAPPTHQATKLSFSAPPAARGVLISEIVSENPDICVHINTVHVQKWL